MTHDFFDGNIKEAQKVQLGSLELIDALFCEVNPIPVKAALNMMNYSFGTPRLPLIEMSDKGKIKLETSLKNYNLI